MHYNNIGRLCGKNNWDLNQGCLARGGTEVQQLYPSFLATGHFWQLVIFGNWSFSYGHEYWRVLRSFIHFVVKINQSVIE